MPIVLYHFNNLYLPILAIETIKQENYALKTESIKNTIVCNDLNNHHTSATSKILKNTQEYGICISIMCKKFRSKACSGEVSKFLD